MKGGLRQSMSWLHTWSGLLLGWLLFAIFLTGTVSYFRHEITIWMQPETHQSFASPESAAVAMRKLAVEAPEAESWSISLPGDRSNTLGISWQNPGEAPGRGKGRPRHGAVLDASTGDVLHPRETAGGNFLYRFHFELYALPRFWARWIVGIATFFMFVAIISGVITHKRIFRDFFTFRPGKGQRSWLDMHNLTAVMALPFHIMITYSGLLLFTSTLMPFAFEGRRGPPPQRGECPPVERPAARGDLAALTDVTPLIRQARDAWGGMPVGRITVLKPASPEPVIELSPARNTKLAASSGGGGGAQRMRFDGLTGALLGVSESADVSVVSGINNVFGTLHRARFADMLLRWVFFVAGVAGTVMVGTGLSLWVAKRSVKNIKAGSSDPGFRLVERLNVGAVPGLCLAVAGYFWINRLLPAELAGRADWEIRSFFILWAAASVFAFVRPVQRGWTELSFLSGVLFAGIPVLSLMTTRSGLFWSLGHGQWSVAGFELVSLLTGACLIYGAWRLAVKAARPANQSRRRSAPTSQAKAEGVQ